MNNNTTGKDIVCVCITNHQRICDKMAASKVIFTQRNDSIKNIL